MSLSKIKKFANIVFSIIGVRHFGEDDLTDDDAIILSRLNNQSASGRSQMNQSQNMFTWAKLKARIIKDTFDASNMRYDPTDDPNATAENVQDAMVEHGVEIEQNTTDIGTNATNIATNATNIADNASDIVDLQGEVGAIGDITVPGDGLVITNAGDISTQDVDISVDAGVMRNTLNVEDGSTADQTNDEIRDANDAAGNSNTYTDSEKTKLGNLTEGYLGYFADPAALNLAHPVGAAGQYATVGSTDTLWAWDTGTVAWVNTDTNSLGDMLKATYDPTAKDASAFSMTNMDEGGTNKIFTSTERSKLDGIEASADVNQAFGTTAGTTTQGNDSRLSNSRTPTGPAGGDLSGTYPNPSLSVSIPSDTEWVKNGGSNSGLTKMSKKVVQFTGWDMNSAPTFAVSHGIAGANIREVFVTIKGDVGSGVLDSPLNKPVSGSTNQICGGVTEWSATQIFMERAGVAAAGFQSVDYDSVSDIRGWITITLEIA